MEWKRGPMIGRGSTATVSLATSTSSGELFAVKSSEFSNSDALQKEQFFLSKLSSPYIVKYLGHEIKRENGELMYNICLEYAPGGTLHDAIAGHGGRLDETTIRSCTRSVIQGLVYLHSNGLAHCDIKSQNILMTEEGAKIADFGCAKFVEGAAILAGTPAFMSPEVARGQEQGFPADVWALGCTVIEMATGKIPWAEHTDDPISALFKIGFSGEAPEIPVWLSEKGKDFLSKCLTRDPRERWTAKELLDHPFVDVKELTMTSPNCVLDQDFWDSMDGLESPNRNFQFENSSNSNFSNRNSPAERIKSLIGCNTQLNWNSREEWITVRSSESMEEKDEILVDTASYPSEFLVSNSVVHEQEFESSSFDGNLFLDVESFIENDNRISENNFDISDGYDFVPENLNFEIDNINKNNRFLSTSISFCFFILLLGHITAFFIFRLRNQFLCFVLIKRVIMIYNLKLFEKVNIKKLKRLLSLSSRFQFTVLKIGINVDWLLK